VNVIDRSNTIHNNEQPELIINDKEIFKIIQPNGTIYFKNSKGELHNINDEPVRICKDASKYWYRNGKQHRDNNEPAVVHGNGYKVWFKNGVFCGDNDCCP